MQTSPALDPGRTTPAAAILSSLSELGRAVAHRLANSDIEGGTLFLLRLLNRLGPARVTELAAQSRLDTSTVSRHVQNLERRGYVVRTPDPDDRRAHRLALSPEGRCAMEEMTQASLQTLEALLADWPSEDVEQFSRYMSRLVHDLQAPDA